MRRINQYFLACLLGMPSIACTETTDCPKFVNYERSSVDVSGLRARIQQFSGNLGSVAVTPHIREASEEIQRMDFRQFSICRQMQSMPDGAQRDALQVEYVRHLMQLDATSTSAGGSTPSSGKTPPSQPPLQPAPSNQPASARPYLPTDSPSAAPEEPRSDEAPFPQQQERTVETRGMRFTLRGCSRSGSEVGCTLSINNHQGERVMRFMATNAGYGSSFGFVGDGIKYSANRVTIGSRSSNGFMRETFIQGEPFSASVIFTNLPDEASAFSTLSLRFAMGRYSSDGFDVRFRNIPIRR